MLLSSYQYREYIERQSKSQIEMLSEISGIICGALSLIIIIFALNDAPNKIERVVGVIASISTRKIIFWLPSSDQYSKPRSGASPATRISRRCRR